MFGRIWSAIAALASSIEALAQSFTEANVRVREGFRLDGVTDEVEALPEPAGNGRKRVSAKGGT